MDSERILNGLKELAMYDSIVANYLRVYIRTDDADFDEFILGLIKSQGSIINNLRGELSTAGTVSTRGVGC